MKTIFRTLATTLCLIFFLSTTIQAQEVFFLNKQGMMTEYSVADAKGKIQSYTKTTVTEVKKKDAKNFTVTYSAEAFDKNKKSMAQPTIVTLEIVDGVIQYDPLKMMGEMASNAEVTGNFSSFPANLEVGQDLGNYSYSIKMMGVSSTTSGKGKVTAKESITTEAGTFDCYKVESETNTKAMLSTTKILTTSWYARGIGAVKVETYDKKGKLQTTQELVSLKK